MQICVPCHKALGTALSYIYLMFLFNVGTAISTIVLLWVMPSQISGTELPETLSRQKWLAETWMWHTQLLPSDTGCWTGQGAALANHSLLPVVCHSSKCVISSWGLHKAWEKLPPLSQDRWQEGCGSSWSVPVGTKPVCEQPCGSSRWSVFQCAQLWQPLASV